MADEQTAQSAIEPPPEAKIAHVDRLRHKFKLLGGALASIAAVGAIVGGLTGYWNAWKAVSTDLLHPTPAVGPSKPAPTAISGGRPSRCSRSKIARAMRRRMCSQTT